MFQNWIFKQPFLKSRAHILLKRATKATNKKYFINKNKTISRLTSVESARQTEKVDDKTAAERQLNKDKKKATVTHLSGRMQQHLLC